MPAVCDRKLDAVPDLRLHVPVHRRRKSEGLEDVQLGDRIAHGGKPGNSVLHNPADLQEERLFDLHYPLRGVVDLRLQVRKTIRREAFPADEGLSAHEMGRHVLQVGLRHLEVIPDDLVVPKLEGGNPRGGPLLLQVRFQDLARVVLQAVEPVELRVESTADEVPIREERGRLVADRPVDQVDHLLHLPRMRGDPLAHA